MTGKIIQIRMLQFIRLISRIGAFRILFILLLALFVAFTTYNILEQPAYTTGFSIVISAVVFFIHTGRKDKRFLRIMSERAYLVFFLEYFLMLLPFTVISLVVSNLPAAGVLLLLCLVVPFFNLHASLPGASSLLRFLVNPVKTIPDFRLNIRIPIRDPRAFEWISGLRSNFLILLPVYMIVLTFSFKAVVAPVGMLLISLLVSGIYYHGEPREFIEIFACKPSKFIVRKVGIAIKYLNLLFIPVVIVSMIFQPETWYWIMGAVILSNVFQAVTIIFKYALFNENSDLSGNTMIVLLNVICILLPFLWPLPLIMGTRYYYKAKQNLKQYFDDFNQ